MKLGNYREKSYKIAQMKVYENEMQSDGSIMRVTKTDIIPDGSTN